MKVGSSANYNVRISKRDWDESVDTAPLYAGIYTFDLNQVVSVSFVPDVSAAGPPWSMAGLPDDGADFTRPEQARLLELLTAAYSVTPHRALAGTQERLAWPFEWPHSDGAPPTPTIFYVTPEEFERLEADLDALTEVAGNVHSVVRRAQVQEHEAVRFTEERILDSPWLTTAHARSIGRTA